LQAEPDKKSTVSVEDKQAIEAIVETARNQLLNILMKRQLVKIRKLNLLKRLN